MENNDNSKEIMPVEYTESDSGIPTMVICNELHIAITNTKFLQSIITNTLLRAYWRFNHITAHKLSFSVDPMSNYQQEPDTMDVSLFLDKEFVGYTTVGNLYTFAEEAMAKIKAIKVERAED